MHSVLFEYGPIKLYSYGLMIAIGFLLALYLMQRDAPKRGLNPDLISELCFWGLFTGVAGSRISHIIMYPTNYSWGNPLGWINITQGGLVFQGAIPAVLLFLYFRTRQKKVALTSVLDLAIPYIPLAQAFGRVGCFLNGCCFGRRSDDLLWAVRFPEGSPPYHSHATAYPDFLTGPGTWSYPVHPTQLYSVILLLIVSGVLVLSRNRIAQVPGSGLAFYFVLYGIIRFIVEMFRGDGNPTNLGFGLITNQQVFCLAMLVTGLGLYAYLRKKAHATQKPIQNT